MKIKNIAILAVTCGVFSNAVAMQIIENGLIVVSRVLGDEAGPSVEESIDWDFIQDDKVVGVYVFKLNQQSKQTLINLVYADYVDIYRSKELGVKRSFVIGEHVNNRGKRLPSDDLTALCDFVRPSALYRFWRYVLLNAKELGGRLLVNEMITLFKQSKEKELLGENTNSMNLLIENLQLTPEDKEKYQGAMSLKRDDLVSYAASLYKRRSRNL